MARQPRTILQGHPYHLIARGHDRQPVFRDDDDRRAFVRCLDAAAREAGFMIHAYVLMTNHVHLVGTPNEPDALARTMQGIGRSYVRRFNRRHGRSGTLWEGRFRAALIDSDRYLLACMRYVESNPVRARITPTPDAWRWSSARHNLGLEVNPIVSAHSVYWGLGNTPFDREQAYRALFAAPVEPQADRVMAGMLDGRPAADDAWLEALEERVGETLRAGPRGRPPKRMVRAD
ncbi:MAG: transposase [Lautropia sp.]